MKNALGAQTPEAEVRYLLERGRVFNSSKNPQKAAPLFIQAFELASKRGMEIWADDAAKKYFALAYQELSKDEWFKANEAKRLQRSKDLGGL